MNRIAVALDIGPLSSFRERVLVTDAVYDALLGVLMDGVVEPGSSLQIVWLARELGVSPTPVREALARLESTGLVRREALRGYRVAPRMTPDELVELMDARLALEPVNVRLATPRADESFFSVLASALTDLEAASRGPSLRELRPYFDAADRFHREIAVQTGNRFLLSAHEALSDQLQRSRLLGAGNVGDTDVAVFEHRRILESMRSGDSEVAVQAMVEHLVGVRERAATGLDTRP